MKDGMVDPEWVKARMREAVAVNEAAQDRLREAHIMIEEARKASTQAQNLFSAWRTILRESCDLDIGQDPTLRLTNQF